MSAGGQAVAPRQEPQDQEQQQQPRGRASVAFDRQADDEGQEQARDEQRVDAPHASGAAPARPSQHGHARASEDAERPARAPDHADEDVAADHRVADAAAQQPRPRDERPRPQPPDVGLEGEVEEPDQRRDQHGRGRRRARGATISSAGSATWWAREQPAGHAEGGEHEGQAEGAAAVAAAEPDVALGEDAAVADEGQRGAG